ncbi:MAG: hypothetical protein ACI3W5_14405 [Faecousia sp.]
MTKTQVKLVVYQELWRQADSHFSFACLEDGDITAPSINADMWNLSFPVGAPLGEIQVTLAFHKEWIDVLAFPHPRIIDENRVLEMVRFVNCLNGYVKLQDTNGRFYVNENELDVAYSARLSYQYLELRPQEAVSHGVLGFLSFVADAAVPLYHIGKGEMTADEGCQYMVELWER